MSCIGHGISGPTNRKYFLIRILRSKQQMYVIFRKQKLSRTSHYTKTVTLIKFSRQIANSFAKVINGHKSKFRTLSNILDGVFSAKSLLDSESCQTSKMELFAKRVVCAKASILDV